MKTKTITIDQSALQLIVAGVVLNIIALGIDGAMDRVEGMAKMIIDDLYKKETKEEE